MSGDAAIGEMIRRLRAVAKVPVDLAPKVARVARTELAISASRGLDPQGRPWIKKKDGGTPLKAAGDAIKATSVRNTVLLEVSGHHARHHLGAVRGGKRGSLRRPILPTTKTPPAMIRAVTTVIIREGEKVLVEGG